MSSLFYTCDKVTVSSSLIGCQKEKKIYNENIIYSSLCPFFLKGSNFIIKFGNFTVKPVVHRSDGKFAV